MYAHYERHGEFAAIWDRLVGAVEIASIAAIWVVFFAPAFYRNWINGSAPVEKAEQG
jgi:hypothetical protein